MIDKAYIIRIPTESSQEQAATCAKTCEEHNIPYEFWEGAYNINREEVTAKTNWIIRPESDPAWHNEFLCTISHLELWKHIVKTNETVAVFEHDAYVKRNFLQLSPKDNEIIFLGFRVAEPDDYECPQLGMFIHHKIHKFEGTHAYCINPTTAKMCLERMSQMPNVPVPVDGLMGVRNFIQCEFTVVVPNPVVGVVGGKPSHTMADGVSARYNTVPPDKFFKHFKKPFEINRLPGTDEWRMFF